MDEKPKPRATAVEVRSTLNFLSEVACAKATKSEPERITNPEDRKTLSALLENIKRQLTVLLKQYAIRQANGVFTLAHLPPWQARQIQRQVDELQSDGQAIERLLGEE